MSLRLPKFLIVGAQKCGTTWLHHQLLTHPDIFLPEVKDHEFFSYTHHPQPEQLQGWSKRYENAGEEQLIGDTNAGYFWSILNPPWHELPKGFNPDIPRSIQQTLGDNVKIIIMLRDPVHRAVSAYLHHIKIGSLSADSDIFSAPAKLGIISIGFYSQHLCHWLKYFPCDNIHVENQPLETNHQQILENTCDFLGVACHQFEKTDQVIHRGINRRFNEDGVWMLMQDITDISKLRRAVPTVNVNGKEFVRVIHPSELDQLKQMYKADQKALTRLLKTT